MAEENRPKSGPLRVTVVWQNDKCKDGPCPGCGMPLTTTLNPRFCGFCGQEVIWDESEENGQTE